MKFTHTKLYIRLYLKTNIEQVEFIYSMKE